MAIKKGHSYATIMVNHDDRNIIDMIESRDIGDVVNMLSKYPNLKIITRDGSTIYKASIEICNPNIIQVGDRFHILKLLSECVKTEISRVLPSNILLDVIEEKYKYVSLKERYNNAVASIKSGISISVAAKTNKINYVTLNKLLKMNDSEIIKYFQSDVEVIRKERIERKIK